MMAALQTIKARVTESREMSGEESHTLHKRLVEDRALRT